MSKPDLFDQGPATPEMLEALGKLSGKIAHDFNNIFAAIQGCLELMKVRLAKLPDGNPVERQLQIMEASIHRGVDITTRLRAWVRPGPIATARKQIEPIVHSVAELLKQSGVIKTDATVVIQASPEVEINEFLFSQALLALCMNAIDAMSKFEDRTLLIVVSEEMASLNNQSPCRVARISVIDHGVGLAPEQKDKIFEPFFSTKKAGIGQAIGLNMVMINEMMKRLGGELEVRSKTGLGTAMSLVLPLDPPTSSPQS